MLRLYSHLKGFHLGATDGEIGKLHDIFFEEPTWTVRYLVADTGRWLPGRRTLLSPYAFEGLDEEENLVRVNLTRSQIENAPPITADEPISREYERRFYQYYGWPAYYYGPALWGPVRYPVPYPPAAPVPDPETENLDQDVRLRSASEVVGYSIHARDGDLGHLEDYVLDDQDWAIRYLVVDTRNWIPGKKVLIAPGWVQEISWTRSRVVVPLDRAVIKEAPEFDPARPLSREYEARLHEHYRYKAYWIEEANLQPER
jgi:hypothetical protein